MTEPVAPNEPTTAPVSQPTEAAVPPATAPVAEPPAPASSNDGEAVGAEQVVPVGPEADRADAVETNAGSEAKPAAPQNSTATENSNAGQGAPDGQAEQLEPVSGEKVEPERQEKVPKSRLIEGLVNMGLLPTNVGEEAASRGGLSSGDIAAALMATRASGEQIEVLLNQVDMKDEERGEIMEAINERRDADKKADIQAQLAAAGSQAASEPKTGTLVSDTVTEPSTAPVAIGVASAGDPPEPTPAPVPEPSPEDIARAESIRDRLQNYRNTVNDPKATQEDIDKAAEEAEEAIEDIKGINWGKFWGNMAIGGVITVAGFVAIELVLLSMHGSKGK